MSSEIKKAKKKLDTLMRPTGEAAGQSSIGEEGQGLLGRVKKEEMPEVAPPIAMPDPIAEAAQQKRQSIIAQKKRRGRASTIMTQNTGA